MLQTETQTETSTETLKQKENLLKYMKDDPNHVWHDLFEISSDCNSIASSFGAEESVIYGGGKFQAERLSKEIVCRTLLANELKYYKEEVRLADDDSTYADGRADLVSGSIEEGSTHFKFFNIVELGIIDYVNKGNVTKNVFERAKDDKFNQILNRYINPTKIARTNDLFATVILMNVKKLIKEPELLSRFLTAPTHMKDGDDAHKLFEECGVFIQTVKYFAHSGELITNKIDNPIISYEMPAHFNIRLSDQRNHFGGRDLVATLGDAVNFSTNSGCDDVRNIRDIKSLSDPEKYDLTKNILNTLNEGFSGSNGGQNMYAMNDNSNAKVLVHIEDKSIEDSTEYAQEHDSYVLCSMSGALVDGQNSLHAVKKIMEMAALPDGVDHNHLSANEYDLFKKIRKRMGNVTKCSEFVDYIKRSTIQIRIQKATDIEHARSIATAKNSMMKVTKLEKEISGNFIQHLQVMSHEISKGTGSEVILTFPKKINYGISDAKMETSVIKPEFLSLVEHQGIQRIRNEYKNSVTSDPIRNMFYSASELSRDQPKIENVQHATNKYVTSQKGANPNIAKKILAEIVPLEEIAKKMSKSDVASDTLEALHIEIDRKRHELNQLSTKKLNEDHAERLVSLARTCLAFKTAESEQMVEVKGYKPSQQRAIALAYCIKEHWSPETPITVDMFTHYFSEITRVLTEYMEIHDPDGDLDIPTLKELRGEVKDPVVNAMRDEIYNNIENYEDSGYIVAVTTS